MIWWVHAILFGGNREYCTDYIIHVLFSESVEKGLSKEGFELKKCLLNMVVGWVAAVAPKFGKAKGG